MELICADNDAKRHQIRYHPFIPRHLPAGRLVRVLFASINIFSATIHNI